MAVNAHWYFGNYIDDRRQEFNALVDWIMSRFSAGSQAYYPNFILRGDLNLDYDNPARDRSRIEERIKSLNGKLDGANVNFPFLDVHPGRQEVFRTNARMTETFAQIGPFNRDPRPPTYPDNPTMGARPQGPDYGVFEFCDLFSEAVLDRPLEELAAHRKVGPHGQVRAQGERPHASVAPATAPGGLTGLRCRILRRAAGWWGTIEGRWTAPYIRTSQRKVRSTVHSGPAQWPGAR